MPCNAVATARAEVAEQEIVKLLTPQVVAITLERYFNKHHPGRTFRLVGQGRSGCTFYVGDFTVYVAGGQVTVDTAPGRRGKQDAAQAEALAQEVRKELARAGGLLFQEQVRTAIKQRYGISAISSEQKSANGALVLNINI